MNDPDSNRASDVPMDLIKERESFVRSFLKKGVEYTEHLLQENAQLRDEYALLQADNARLRAQVASDDAIRDLLRTVEKLESERNALLAHSTELEEKRIEHQGRHDEIEQEVNDLANLYIASYQLGASLSLRRVVRHLRDMCGQLVGAHGFVIYAIDTKEQSDGPVAYPIAFEQLDPASIAPIPVGVGPVGEACLTGIPRIREDGSENFTQGSHDNPVAVIPMISDGKPVGAISVITLLEQKSQWMNVDRELFQLLGAQAGTALIAANLYASDAEPLNALRGLRQNLAAAEASTSEGAD